MRPGSDRIPRTRAIGPSLRPAALIAVLGLVFSGCSTEGLAFREDKRVAIVAPVNRGTMRLPTVLRWTVRDFEAVGPDGSARTDAGRFAVFVDRSPVKPGRPLADMAEDDDACKGSPGCPDDAWFRDRNVFMTTETSLEITALRDTRPRDHPEMKDRHEIVVILVNGRDERIGEAAFSVEFFVDRSGKTR